MKKIYLGVVVSDKMDKTIVAKVERTFNHPRFHKVINTFKKYKVHDEQEQAKVGDVIEFAEGRPLSKTKCWYLVRIINGNSEQKAAE